MKLLITTLMLISEKLAFMVLLFSTRMSLLLSMTKVFGFLRVLISLNRRSLILMDVQEIFTVWHQWLPYFNQSSYCTGVLVWKVVRGRESIWCWVSFSLDVTSIEHVKLYIVDLVCVLNQFSIFKRQLIWHSNSLVCKSRCSWVMKRILYNIYW